MQPRKCKKEICMEKKAVWQKIKNSTRTDPARMLSSLYAYFRLCRNTS